jgi:hypothetical protein
MRSLMLSFTVLSVVAAGPALAQNTAYPSGPPGNAYTPNAYPPNAYGPGPQGNAYPPNSYPPNTYAPGPQGTYAPGPQGNAYTPGDAGFAEVPAPPSHQPLSRRATNINQQDTRSVISPSLPAVPVGPNADATQYLQAAQSALSRGRTGEAQEALENAETYLLNRSVPQGAVNQPDQSPAVNNVSSALQALGAGDRGQAMNLIQQAITMTQTAMNGPGPVGMPPPGPGTYQPGTYQPPVNGPGAYAPGPGGTVNPVPPPSAAPYPGPAQPTR